MFHRLVKLILQLIKRQVRMSAQLDALTAAQKQTADAVAALQAAITNQPKPDDLTAAIATEQANAAAIAAITATIPAPAPAV